jgi:transposase
MIPTAPLASIGIDIGKEVFHVVGFGTDGKIAFRRKIKRLALVETFRRLPPSVVGMEACQAGRCVSCFAPVNGHRSSRTPCLKSANTGSDRITRLLCSQWQVSRPEC